MAIKILDTEVISDSRTVLVTGAAGVYDTLNPSYSVSLSNIGPGTSSINFYQDADGINHGSIYWDTAGQLGGAMTWSINAGSGVATGRTKIMFVDATAAGYDQTFTFTGGTILWPEDTEPDFSLARYWAHYITCWDSTTVSIVSTSWSSM